MEDIGRTLNHIADVVARGERIESGEPAPVADGEPGLTFHEFDESTFERYPVGQLGSFEEVFNDRAFSPQSTGMLPVLWAVLPAQFPERQAPTAPVQPLPRPLQLVMALCRHANLRALSSGKPDPDFVHGGICTTAWPVGTDAGWMDMVEIGGRAILLRHDTGEQVCELASAVIENPKTATLDSNTRASNPGGVPVKVLRWFRHYPDVARRPVLRAALCLIAGLAAAPWLWFVSPISVIFALACLEPVAKELRRVREQFRHGCANPAVIVALDPMLIAVATDLTKGKGPFPVVKIIQKELPAASGRKPEIGARLCTVSVYIPGKDPKRWETFDPRPVDCATADQQVIDRTMRTFQASDWEELQEWIAQVPKPLKVGQYSIAARESAPA